MTTSLQTGKSGGDRFSHVLPWPPRDDVAILIAQVGLATAAYVIPWAPIYLPVLISLVVLTWLRFESALLLVILFAPTFMAPKHLWSREFPMSEILLALDLGVFLGLLLARRVLPAWQLLRRSPFLAPGLLFLMAAAVSTVGATDHAEAFRRFRETVAEPELFVAMLLVTVPDRRRWKWIIVAIVAAGLGASLISLFQLATGHELTSVAGSSVPRVRSLYGSPDNLGLLLDRCIPLCVALAVSLRLSGRMARVAWSAVGLLMSVLLLTFSRGAWIATAIGLLFVLFMSGKKARIVAMAALLVALVGLVAESTRVVTAVNSGHTQTIERRLDLWRSALRLVRDHPIVGVGPDNFLQYYAPVNQAYSPCRGRGYMEPSAAAEPCLSHPHNELLDFWLSTGILGLAAFLWLEAVFWRHSFARIKALASSDRAWLIGAMAAMLASLIHGLVDNSYFLEDLAVIFWVLCAYVSFTSVPFSSSTSSSPAVT